MTLTCGHGPSEHSEITTGYGTNSQGETFCYACIAEMDKQYMIEHGHSKGLPLYLNSEKREVTNWPGSLRFKAGYIRKGWHNIAGTRYDTWFVGPDSYVWHGTQYGEFTQIIHCKRTKERAK